MQKRHVRAEEYRRLALQSATLAEASALDHVREKHERAAAQWLNLAELDERSNGPTPAAAPLLPALAI
jgi:hypothetical protein